jgi:RNA polymerase sigma-70 factor (ECF subfamily)
MSAADQRGPRRLRLVPSRPAPGVPEESAVHPALDDARHAQPVDSARRELPVDPARRELPVDPARRELPVDPARRELPVDPSTTPVPASTSFPADPAWDVREDGGARDAHKRARPSARVDRLGDLPDGQLVALAATGDNRAFEALYRRHVAFALHLATRIEGSSRDVEDVVHDAFLRAFERLGDLADRNAFRAWLGAIVVHAVRSRLRRMRLMNLLGLGRASEPVDLDALASPDCSPHVRAQIAQVYALLRTLPTDDRIAWTLRAVEGHDLETVARLSSCSLATVKRRISRAQKFLDDHFIHTGPEQGES